MTSGASTSSMLVGPAVRRELLLQLRQRAAQRDGGAVGGSVDCPGDDLRRRAVAAHGVDGDGHGGGHRPAIPSG